jgi:cysteine-rich repeat protein
MPCHKPGSLANVNEWRWASHHFITSSLGEGEYHVVLFSMDIKEIIATASMNVTANTIEKRPSTHDFVPPDSGGSIDGGLKGCEALVVTSRCCMVGNISDCVKLPDPTGIGVNEDDLVVILPQRCGDGRLELGGAAASQQGQLTFAGPVLVPLESAKERDGRAEECDDGNNVNGDGCDAGCRIEANTNCSYHPNTNFSRTGPRLCFDVGHRLGMQLDAALRVCRLVNSRLLTRL